MSSLKDSKYLNYFISNYSGGMLDIWTFKSNTIIELYTINLGLDEFRLKYMSSLFIECILLKKTCEDSIASF